MIVNSELLDEADPIGSAFARIIGLPAWRVQKGHGSFLTFEFGAPHLSIREPIAEPSIQNPKIRKRLQRRRVAPHGEWHLWIYCSHWRCAENGVELSTDESADAEIIAAAEFMDGQCLLSVGIEAASGRSLFRFDLGATLETWPYDGGDEEQWFLYAPSKHVLSYRADGHYSWRVSDQTPDEENWLPLG
jgi:hypothetical protein